MLTEKQINIMKIAIGFDLHNGYDEEFKTKRNFYNCYSWSKDLEKLIECELMREKITKNHYGFKSKDYALTSTGFDILSHTLGIKIEYVEELN